MKKVFVLVYSFAIDGELGTDVSVFATFEKAKERLETVKEEAIAIWKSANYYCESFGDESSFTIYEKENYNVNYDSWIIKEMEVLC